MREEILTRIQKRFPLVARPFLEIAQELNSSEEEVLKILNEEKKANIIRQTSAIFDTKRLGYKSSLVSFKIDEEEIGSAVKILNSHPGISHNYERDHDFNIWFTLAVAPNSILGLEKTVEILAKLTRAREYIILPTLKLFKINVKLDIAGKDEKKEEIKLIKHKDIELTPMHHQIIRYTQNDITFKKEPFEDIIKAIGISYDEFFKALSELQDAGVMRRFASILNHRKAGFSANAMVVWDIDEHQANEIGAKAALFSAVSHCYLRPKYPNWPFNLFTMVHGKSTQETNALIEEMAQEIKHSSKMALYSTKEFKKVRIEYFIPEFDEWEERYKNY